mgnify:CR=1 FL=1
MLLVILEHENGQLVEAAREALTFGRVLAETVSYTHLTLPTKA